MRFEWDDQKARENLKTHGVTFGEATEVFYDPYALEAYDIEHSTIEARFFIIRVVEPPIALRGLCRTH